MKCFNPTYYLLTILCIMIASCTTDGVMEDFTDSKGQILVKDAHINFVLTFPANPSTRASENEGLESERSIDNLHIYTFQNDQFVEEIQYIVIDGKDGDTKRNIDGKLSATYDGSKPMEFVVIANAENKGVNNFKITKGQNKADLYEQLSFNFNKTQDWSKEIPMWGMGTIENIKTGGNNFGALDLIRAVAKVNVTVANGTGLKNFEITEIRLHHYNTKGYCTPTVNDGPSIPANSTIASTSEYLTSGTLSGNQGNRFENKFYIPEHKNIGITNNDKKVCLTINAKVREVEKTYTVQFSTNGKAYNVLRNHLYVFNITSVDKVTSKLTYEVKQWEYVTVDVPAFN